LDWNKGICSNLDNFSSTATSEQGFNWEPIPKAEWGHSTGKSFYWKGFGRFSLQKSVENQ